MFVRSCVVSLVATVLALAAYAFIFGSYASYPSAAAAELAGVPVSDQAAWMASNIKIVQGAEYASFLINDPSARAVFLGAAGVLFLFGFVCAYAGALLQRRRAVA